MQSPQVRRWLPFAVVLLYLLLALGRAFTTTPWNDEAWYSSPSWNLIHHGITGTPFLETASQFWRGINFRTYWVVPLQFFVQVPWFYVFGFSLLSARLFAMAWGLVGLVSWYFIVKRLTGNPLMAFWTMLLLGCDYQFVSQMALDRMDAMSLGLAALAILAYVELREKHLLAAVFASQFCVAACGLTHPTPGIPILCAVLFLALYFDRSRITWQVVPLAAIPYLLFGAFWYWYISPAPDLFRAQFLGNVTDIDRLGGFHHPLLAVMREIRRHIDMGGFQAGMAPLYKIKILSVAIYIVGAISLLANRDARKDPGIRPLLGLWLVYVVVMTFYDNTKEVKYAVHLVPVYDAVVAAALVWFWQRMPKLRVLASGLAALFLLVNIGGLFLSSYKDDYHKQYLPVADFLKTHAKSTDLILAGSEFGFAMGFDRNMVDDIHFTYYSHKKPDFIVLSPNYKAMLEAARLRTPDAYNFAESMLANQFQRVYSVQGYDVLQRKTAQLSLSAPVLSGEGGG
jgi:4-amino-4-deoxy-L-arabinose transferase-like glycosyltransferase